MNAISLAPSAAFTGRIARNRVRARLGTARGTAPVRRRSDEAGDITRPMSMGERRHIVQVLEAYARENRGDRGVAPLTASTLQVARTMLFVLMDRETGRIEHAYSWIARHSRRAYQTACAAVAQLVELKVLKVQTRCRPGDGPDSPVWVQDTNLYAFEIPPALRAWWAARTAAREARSRARAPEDAIWGEGEGERRNTAQEAQRQANFAEMTRAEFAAELKWVADVLRITGRAVAGGAIRRLGPS